MTDVAELKRKAIAATEIEELEALSRKRALTEAESMTLERAILYADGKRIPYRLTRELARHGVKRDMRRYR